MSERDLLGRVFLVTGANTGIGRATAEALARRGATLYLACRSAEKTAPVIAALKAASGHEDVHLLALDLGDLDSVRACAAAFLARGVPLHGLIANAGLASTRGLTASGFELAFGVNHVGHALLARLLEDHLKASAPSRLVIVSSKAHFRARGVDYVAVRAPTATTTGLAEYEVSKLANVMFASVMAARLAGTGVTTYSLHPGVIASDIWRRVPWPARALMKLFMKNTEDGARTTVYCATAPECAAETGLYYDDCKVYKASKVARDEAAQATLWRETAAWIGLPA